MSCTSARCLDRCPGSRRCWGTSRAETRCAARTFGWPLARPLRTLRTVASDIGEGGLPTATGSVRSAAGGTRPDPSAVTAVPGEPAPATVRPSRLRSESGATAGPRTAVRAPDPLRMTPAPVGWHHGSDHSHRWGLPFGGRDAVVHHRHRGEPLGADDPVDDVHVPLGGPDAGVPGVVGPGRHAVPQVR